MHIFVSDELKETASTPAPWGSVAFTFALGELWEVAFSLDSAPLESHNASVLKSPWVDAVKEILDTGRSITKEEREALFATKRAQNFTETTRKVLEETSLLPCGTFKTYGEIAEAIGSPEAVRAIGQILARNPFPILIPCHRVMAKAMVDKLDILNPKSFEGKAFGGREDFVAIGAWLRMNDLTHAA